MKNLLKLSSTLALLGGFLACAGQTETPKSKPLSLFDDIYPLWSALEENGSTVQLRFVTLTQRPDGDWERKCLTDVSAQTSASRDVSWNTCATSAKESDHDLQIWTMQKVVPSTDGLRYNVIYRDVDKDLFSAKFLQVGTDASIEGLQQNKLHLDRAILSRGSSLPANKFTTFNHYSDSMGKDPTTKKTLSINTLERMTYTHGYLGVCLSKPGNQDDTLGAFLIQFTSQDNTENMQTIKSNCADIQFELISSSRSGAQ